ncbi:hypothetical protein ACHAWF_002277 [Thalassiosira exigua]
MMPRLSPLAKAVCSPSIQQFHGVGRRASPRPRTAAASSSRSGRSHAHATRRFAPAIQLCFSRDKACALIRASNPTARAFHRCSSSVVVQGCDEVDDVTHVERRGEELYRLAAEALTKSAKAKEDREERLLREQFDAMERQKRRTRQRGQKREAGSRDPRLQRLDDSRLDDREGAKDRAAGVAVVRTIVKQAQKDNVVQVDRWDNSQADARGTKEAANAATSQDGEEERWQQLAQEHMEEAALRYGHCLALVRLGNEALERANSDSASTLAEPLIKRERCGEWISESPINLVPILELVSRAEVKSQEDGMADDDSPSTYLRLALHLYEDAGNGGSAEGWYNLGHLLWDGHGTQPCAAKERAMEAFHRSMELGDADAMYFVASQYLSCQDEIVASLLPGTYERYGPTFVASLRKDSLEENESTVMHSLSTDFERHGHELLCLAAHGYKHGPALHHLALLHNQHSDVRAFAELLHRAAEAGNPDSLFLRGHCRYFGTDGHDRDFQSALGDFLAAAECGHVDAMVSAGAILHRGFPSEDGREATERDQRRAFELYQRAGELGSVEGWRNVVSCYATGQGVPKCLDTAKHIASTLLKE